MAQYARPDSDIALGGWSNPSWSRIDEVVADDATTRTQELGGGTVLKVGLSNVQDPQVSTGHIVRFRAHKSGDGAATLNGQLYQGITLIAGSGAQTLTTVYKTFAFTLTGCEADAISDPTDLRLWFTPTGLQDVTLTWAELEVPDVAAKKKRGPITNIPCRRWG